MSPRPGWKRVGTTVGALALVGVVGWYGIGVLLAPRYPDAREIVTGYFAALARGDAAAALSYGESAPESTEFLTDEILRKQIAAMPVTAECGKSRLLAPPDCPQRVGIHGNALVDGTVSWGQPDLSATRLTFNDHNMTVRFDKMAEFPFTATTTSGATHSGTANSYLGGNVDIAQDPPRVTFG